MTPMASRGETSSSNTSIMSVIAVCNVRTYVRTQETRNPETTVSRGTLLTYARTSERELTYVP